MNRLVFTAFSRPKYFQQAANSWASVRGLADWTPTVHLEPSGSQDEMTRIAANAGMAVYLNPRRYGVLHNPWVALDTAFDTATFAVLAEDDVLVSDDILEYFTWAATAYANDNILAICANTKAASCQPEFEHRVTRSNQFSSLIWGTWKDRWDSALRDTWDHDYSSGTREHPQSGWDWNINLRVMGDDWNIINPCASRSTHIGQFGGSHTTFATWPGSQSPTFRAHRAPGAYHL